MKILILSAACLAVMAAASGAGAASRTPGAALDKADANHDGYVTRDEFRASRAAQFQRLDRNDDGVVTLSDDGLTAQCRARAQVQGNSPPGSGQFLFAEGLYENTYVKQADGWRIKRLWWVPTYYFQIAGFDKAIFDSGPPSEDFPPDRPSVPKDEALGRRFPGFHYSHPVTGEAVGGPTDGRGGSVSGEP